MKKILCSTMTVLFLGIFAFAQDMKTDRADRAGKSFVVLAAGPTFPIGDFSAVDMDNEEAGSAKTGYTIEAKFGHHFNKFVGIAAGALYSRFDVDKSFAGASNVTIDPWQYFNILVGPMITGTVSSNTHIDISVLTGISFANSPRIAYMQDGTSVVATDDWSKTVPVRADADFRYKFSNRGFLLIGANYQYTRPKFNINIDGDKMAFKQSMSVIGINAGIGLSL